MLVEYEWRGSTYQFNEDEAPADAVPVKAKQAAKNKSKTGPSQKSGEDEADDKAEDRDGGR